MKPNLSNESAKIDQVLNVTRSNCLLWESVVNLTTETTQCSWPSSRIKGYTIIAIARKNISIEFNV